MRDQLRGMKLEAMADMRQSRKRKLLLSLSTLALVILSFYSVVNFFDGKLIIATCNIIGALLCAAHFACLLGSKKEECSPFVPSVAVLINAFANIATPDGTIFWAYPIIAAILMINEFRTALIYTGVFFAGTIIILMLESTTSITYFSYQNLSTDKFLLSIATLCLITLISNYGYRTASDYLQDLYQEGIDQLAYRDRLTGLANRWSFEVWSNRKLEAANQQSSLTALVFLDVDNFKTINDTHGHDVGDEILQLFADRLTSNFRCKDRDTHKDDYSIARYAGDEFMLLLHDVPTMTDLKHIVERINQLFTDKVQLQDAELSTQLTFSIGVAIYKQDANSLEELIRCADRAMYQAKSLGKNRYHFYHNSQNQQANGQVVKLVALDS